MNKIALICLLVFTINCGSDKTINNRDYETVGFATQDEKDPCIKYELITGNLIWSIILFETIFAPVYFLGWSLWEPDRTKTECVGK